MNTPSFPPVDAAISAIRQINWRDVAHKLIMLAATVCAIVVALSVFTYRHARQFWRDHGDEITLQALTFAGQAKAVALTAANATIRAVRVVTPVVTLWVNRTLDSAFYQLAAF
jgi:hypothetical protein